MKKLLIYFLGIIILLSGCSKVGTYFPDGSEISIDATEPAKTLPPVTTQEVEADVPEIEVVDFSAKLEAEAGVVTGDLKLSQTKKGYTGAGYLTGFTAKSENSLKISVNVPTSQHYDVSMIVAADAKRNNILTINDDEISEFITSGAEGFEKITIKNVFIKKGVAVIGIKEVNGGIDIDSFQIKNSKDIANLSFSVENSLINPNANAKTKNTMSYITENYGKNIISGQYASIGTNRELELIYKTTGRYPAVRLGDLMSYTSDSITDIDEIGQAIKWSEKGGLVSYVWHWEAPMNESSYYTEDTTFDLSKAVTDEDIALLSYKNIEKLYEDKKISEECLAIIRDIDIISEQLSKLQKEDVTVLWRPLHEASGGWFWWGASGKDSYEWLWNLIYERQTNYHKLNNLIWVWNAQDADWYVGDDKCDVISADVYNGASNQSSQVNTFLQLAKISSKKIISLSECANPPNVDFMIRDKAMWSWFGVWSGNYIMDDYGELTEAYTTKDELINTYSHQNVITLEKLPDLRVEK